MSPSAEAALDGESPFSPLFDPSSLLPHPVNKTVARNVSTTPSVIQLLFFIA
jgi:hypothetical protein